MRLFEETPGMGILRNLLYAVAIAMLYSLGMAFTGKFNAGFLPAYMLIGISLSFFGWGGERLWYATVHDFFKQPFRVAAVLTHIPLWGMLGGIGYTVAMVSSKKIGILQFNDIPIKNIFFTGAACGSFFQSILYLIDMRIRRSRQIINEGTEHNDT